MVKPIIYLIFVFGLLFLSLIKRDSKRLYTTIMLLCWGVIALSMDSYDIGSYRWAYDAQILRNKDPLFDLTQTVFTSLGIPFFLFKIMYGTFICVMLYKAFPKYTRSPALAAALFVLGPMMGYGTQMRSSIAGVIVLIAIPLLLKKDAKIWKYCLLVGIATLFHVMAAFYFLFLIPKLLNANSVKFKRVVFALAIFIPILIFSGILSSVAVYFQGITQGSFRGIMDRVVRYLTSEDVRPTVIGFLFTAGNQFVVFMITDIMCASMLRLRRSPEFLHKDKLYLSEYAVEYLRKINSLLIILIPCYAITLQVDRFYIYYTPVCYALMAQALYELRLEGKYKKHLEIMILLAVMVLSMVITGALSPDSEFARIINGIGAFGG